MFRRFLGLPELTTPGTLGPSARDGSGESESVRRLVARLDALPPDRARFLACFAYTLARAANADSDMSADETALMEQIVAADGGLSAEQAAFVVRLAEAQAGDVNGNDDFLVTREFLEVSTRDERVALVRACLPVEAADGTITAEESAVANEVANELQLNSEETAVLRAEFADRMSALQALRKTAGLT